MRQSISALCAVLVMSLALAACGGDDDTKSSGQAAAPAAATTKVEPPPSSPPTQIPITEPLPKAPSHDKKVIFLQCPVPVCELYASGWKAAADALGWSQTTRVYRGTDPGASIRQAISERPD